MAEGFNHFPEIADKFDRAISQAVRKTALDLQAVAAIKAPIDTGFLRNSIYTVTTKGSSYGKAHAMSSSGKKKRISLSSEQLLPEVGKPGDDWSAYVAVGAMYGIFVEMGTVRAPAQPYFFPAIDFMRPIFESVMAKISAKMEEASSSE